MSLKYRYNLFLRKHVLKILYDIIHRPARTVFELIGIYLSVLMVRCGMRTKETILGIIIIGLALLVIYVGYEMIVWAVMSTINTIIPTPFYKEYRFYKDNVGGSMLVDMADYKINYIKKRNTWINSKMNNKKKDV